MSEVLLDAEIAGIGRAVELGAMAEEADREVWGSAGEVVGRRGGVTADWGAVRRAETIRLPLRIVADDPAWYAELYLHDVFLMFNLASPGSFGGTVSLAGAGDFTLDQRLFEYAWSIAARGRGPRIESLPLARVAAWYDGQRLDPSRAANTPIARALFHLLHLARSAEDEVLSVVRLAQAAEALGLSDAMLFAMRDAVVRADAPVSHPALEDDERSLQRIEVADNAAAAVTAALQALIRK